MTIFYCATQSIILGHIEYLLDSTTLNIILDHNVAHQQREMVY